MSFIDGTAVNVALPILQHDLHASAAAGQWVVESYALACKSCWRIGSATLTAVPSIKLILEPITDRKSVV